jgi:peptidoglycan/xylan/chitin deacetylase (PgdA/CDA1 family)
VAEIYEEYGLRACFNVIASGHLPSFKAVGDWILPELLGDFHDWNVLKSRGHEVMPHSWEHLNLPRLPLNQAKVNIDKCLDFFEKNLAGYQASEAVYNFAFNASTPELDRFVLQRVRAVRTGGWLVLNNSRVNSLTIKKEPLALGCWSNGPDYCDDFVEQEINDFLKEPGGWLIINVHGLDNEGWGPLRTEYLDGLLKRLVDISHLDILPAGALLSQG